MLRVCLFVVLVVGLSACAPVILTRTPTPTAPGVTDTNLGFGYPFGLTALPSCDFASTSAPLIGRYRSHSPFRSPTAEVKPSRPTSV